MNRSVHSVFVFDFDGTLVDSNKIKKETFFKICSQYNNEKSYLNKLLSSSENYDRFMIFEKFCDFYKVNDSYLKLVEQYSELSCQKIKNCSKREGAQELLSQLFISKKQVFINSATPEEELKKVVRLKFDFQFNGIFGRPNSKESNLKKIMNLTRSYAKNIIMIGDGIDDLQAANIIGCKFIGVNNGSLESIGKKNLINDLNLIKNDYFQ